MSNNKETIPSILVNNHSPDEYYPLTTEEPVRRQWLRTELEELNNDSEAEDKESIEDDDITDSSDDDSVTGRNKIKQILETVDTNDSEGSGDIMDYLSREMIDYQAKQNDETEEYEQRVAEAETEDELLGAEDPELLRRTESNRYIPFEEDTNPVERPETNYAESDILHKDLLVFSDNPTTIEEANRIVVIQYYGAGKSGVMPNAHRSKRKPKLYLVACDFSKESLYAMEWTMGAMMRDGDEIHIATVANRDDNPEVVKATGLDQAGEVFCNTHVEELPF